MDATLTVLDVGVLALGGVLASLTAATAVRYQERRFALIGLAMAGIGLVGALGLANLIWPGSLPSASLGWTTSLVLIVAELLLYLSLVVGRPRGGPPEGAPR